MYVCIILCEPFRIVEWGPCNAPLDWWFTSITFMPKWSRPSGDDESWRNTRHYTGQVLTASDGMKCTSSCFKEDSSCRCLQKITAIKAVYSFQSRYMGDNLSFTLGDQLEDRTHIDMCVWLPSSHIIQSSCFAVTMRLPVSWKWLPKHIRSDNLCGAHDLLLQVVLELYLLQLQVLEKKQKVSGILYT